MKQNNKAGRLKLFSKIKDNLKTDLKIKLLVGYLIINLLYLLIGSCIFFNGNIIEEFHYKEFAIGLRFFLVFNIIALLVIIFIKWKDKELKCFKRPIYLGVLLCIIFAIVSTIFAYDPNIALEGCWGRYEGLYTVLYYLTLMVLSTFVKEKYKKILVHIIVISGVIQTIFAIFQCFHLFNVKQIKDWSTGFSNNPNFYGTNMVLSLSYSFGLLIDSKKIKNAVIYFILSCLLMFGLLISNTACAAVGLIFVFVYIFIYCLKTKYYEKLLAVLVIILSITCLAVGLKKTTLVKDLLKVGKEATEVAKGNFDDSFGTKRMFIWKKTMEIVPKYIWHGVGVDSFHKAFNGNALIRVVGTHGSIYDKAHNEYLQTLVTQGIFALSSYLFIYGYAVYYGIKTSKNTKQIYFVLPVIGYLVQAFFNISTIEVAPLFYIALGLCCGKEQGKIEYLKNTNNETIKEKEANYDDSITVLMTTYDEKKEVFIKAIESILKQTYKNIKILIIVDNKSNKELIELIKHYQIKDNRIKFVINEQNIGLAESLNKGIDSIDTKYIARMDADDIAFEDRIEKQLKYAKENPQIDLSGANVEFIDYEGTILYKRNEHAMRTEKIKKVVKYINMFYHPTFFGKTDVFKKYKYRNIKYSQDYDFICRLLEDNCNVENIKDCLLYYRKPKQINEEKRYIQRISHYCIQKLYKKSKLIDTDIQQYIQECLNQNKKKKEKIIKGFLLHDKALSVFKQKKYLKGFLIIFRSLFFSKYQLREIINLTKYEMIK